MTEPLISVIVPVYKVEPYLRAALDSLVQQTLTDWEAVCVDDGSPDASGAILDEYARADSRFRVIHQANGGVSRARNVALDAARGRYVTMMDPDDLLPPCALEALYRPVREDPTIELVFGRVLWVMENGFWLAPALSNAPEPIVGPVTDRAVIGRGASGLPSGKLYIRRLSEKEPMRFREELRYAEDHEFYLRLFMRAKCFYALDDEVYRYYVRSSSAMGAFEAGRSDEQAYIDFSCCKSSLCAQIPTPWSREEQVSYARGLVFFFWRDWARSVRGAAAGAVVKMFRVAFLSLRRGLQEAHPLIRRAEFFAIARAEADRVFAAVPRMFRTPGRYVLYQGLRACYHRFRGMLVRRHRRR